MEGTNAVVKDFQELDNKNVLSEEKYQATVDALNDAYLYDSDTVLFIQMRKFVITWGQQIVLKH